MVCVWSLALFIELPNAGQALMPAVDCPTTSRCQAHVSFVIGYLL